MALPVARLDVLGGAGLECHGSGCRRPDEVRCVVHLRLDRHRARCGAGIDACALGGVAELDEVDVACDRPRDLRPNERYGRSDCCEHLGMRWELGVPPKPFRDLGDECCAGAAQGDQRDVRRKPVLLRSLRGRGCDLEGCTVEQRARGVGGRRAESPRQRLERGERRGGAALRVHTGRDEPERVRRTGGGKREPTPHGVDACIRLGIAGSRGDEYELGGAKLVGRRERRVRQPRDVRAPRADVGDPASTEQRHAPACNTDDPAVDGTDEGGLAHHTQRPELRSPAAHDRNVGARAAALDDDAVGDPQLVEHGSDSRSRSRPDRERRVVAEPPAAHGAPVAAQDEQRHIEARLGERVFHHRGRPFDDRKDARVDRRGQRPSLQPVRAGELVSGARG